MNHSPGNLSAAIAADPRESSDVRSRILVVDDVSDNRDLILRRFSRRGFDVVEAESGPQALERVDAGPFDAILLDIMMPGMDGLEVLRRLREKYSAETLPVIMVTAKGESADVVRALELGANDYVTKPVDFAIAHARVTAQVARKRASEQLQASLAALKETNERLEHEIASRRRSEAQTQYLASHDVLTGLGNRALLQDRLSQAILYCTRYHRRVAVAFIDLDNFKIVNDSLGHKAGDELLRTLAARMSACVRSSDIVARFGGDEFVIVLLDQPDDENLIAEVVNKIRTAIAGMTAINGHPLRVTSSIGVAIFPHDGANAEALINNADAAMYRAKETGRDNLQFYRPAFNHKAYEKFLLLEDLRDALARGEFILDYQPQVDLRSRKIFAVEALIRWRHPRLGMISPIRFIPLAEESGMILSIGGWVIQEACRQNKAWQDSGLPAIGVCVNVSARQFRQRSLIKSVVTALANSGLDAKYLELELTESLIMQDLDQAIVTMRELNDLGVQLSIDDFGTGYSSLAALKNFPIARLKIDKSFIADLGVNENDRTVAGAVISLGQKLHLRVIAEGVETEEQAAFLREHHCEEMQGDLFSKPVDARRIAEMLRAGR